MREFDLDWSDHSVCRKEVSCPQIVYCLLLCVSLLLAVGLYRYYVLYCLNICNFTQKEIVINNSSR